MRGHPQKGAVLLAGLVSEVLILKYLHRRCRAPCFGAGAIRRKDRAENLAIGLGRGMSIQMKYPESSEQAQGRIEVDMIEGYLVATYLGNNGVA
jgi:hypothetical protein